MCPFRSRRAYGPSIKKGQVIGKLGNTGNSSGPHLHFQLSDGPDITTSNSLPFSLDSYWLAGAVDPVQLGAAADAHGVPPPLRVIGLVTTLPRACVSARRHAGNWWHFTHARAR
jgi:murein DD-endopeptidase MepM/ murein hydrolase activator NlpD